MAKRSIEIELDLQNRDAQRALKDTVKALGDVEEALDEGQSAGKRMARAIEQSAADMIAEIDDTAAAVKALERALGPDFDADTREVVADLKAIGLTAQDIEADADELAAALRKSGDVKVHAAKAGFEDLGQAVGSVREDTGRAKDTMSGFIGGTVGELPGISEAMGPVSEGLGQLAEGALNGEINFKQLALAGGAMAGVAFVLGKVQDRMQRIAEAKAWREDQVRGYEDALNDTASAAEAVAQKLRDSEELIINIGEGLLEVDAVPILAQAGVNVEQFSQLVAGGEEAIDRYKAAMEASGVENDAWKGVVMAATQEAKFLAEAQDSAAVAAQFFGDETENSAEKTEALRDAAKAARDRIAEMTRAMVDASGGAYNLEKAELDLADAVANHEQAALASKAVLDSSTASAGEKDQALRDLRNSEIATAETALALAQAYATEKGAQDGTAHSARLQLEKLRELQGQYPGNAAALQPYIDKLLAVPGVVDTQVRADTWSANDAVDSLWRKLDALGARVTTTAVVAAARFRQYASGTSSAPAGMALVGEQGPELVNLPSGAQVKNAGATARMLTQGNARSTTVNVTNNFPAGSRPVDVEKAIRDWRRTQGPM